MFYPKIDNKIAVDSLELFSNFNGLLNHCCLHSDPISIDTHINFIREFPRGINFKADLLGYKKIYQHFRNSSLLVMVPMLEEYIYQKNFVDNFSKLEYSIGGFEFVNNNSRNQQLQYEGGLQKMVNLVVVYLVDDFEKNKNYFNLEKILIEVISLLVDIIYDEKSQNLVDTSIIKQISYIIRNFLEEINFNLIKLLHELALGLKQNDKIFKEFFFGLIIDPNFISKIKSNSSLVIIFLILELLVRIFGESSSL